MRTTTYGEVLSQVFYENTDVHKIHISYIDPYADEKELYLTDTKDIIKIIEHPANMKLKRNTRPTEHYRYYLTFYSNNNISPRVIIVDKSGNIEFGLNKYNYQMINEKILLEVLESFEEQLENL